MKKIGIIATLVLSLAATVLAAGHRDIRATEAKGLLATTSAPLPSFSRGGFRGRS